MLRHAKQHNPELKKGFFCETAHNQVATSRSKSLNFNIDPVLLVSI